jgi:transcriptional regulator with XRE-family HTH domain
MDQSIGERLRSLRGRRSQKAIAELAGVSQGHLSNLEHGRKQLDSRRLIARLAEALEVTAADILGQPWRTDRDPALQAAHGAVDRIRLRLMDTAVKEPDGPTAPLPDLERQTATLVGLRRDCLFDQALAMSPSLLGALHTKVAESDGAEQARALELLFTVASSVSSCVRKLGYTDLAWIAAERAREAVLYLDDPGWPAKSARMTAQTLVAAGAFQRALDVAGRAADQVSRMGGSPAADAPADALHGALLLTGSFAAAAMGKQDEAADRLATARQLAERTGEQGMRAFMFGPTNVAIHEISAAVELGRGERVIPLSRRVDPAVVESGDRLAMFHTDVARGLVMVPGQGYNAIAALRRGERAAPQRVRTNVFVRELVSELMPQARQGEDRRWLQAFATRVHAVI